MATCGSTTPIWAAKRLQSRPKPGPNGRGAANNIPFVGAVETVGGKLVYMQLRRVSGFTKEAIETYANANIEPDSWLVSDGPACFPGVPEAGLNHIPIPTGRGIRSSRG